VSTTQNSSVSESLSERDRPTDSVVAICRRLIKKLMGTHKLGAPVQGVQGVEEPPIILHRFLKT